jgi:hypothetical protein
MSNGTINGKRLGMKGVIGVASCVIGLGVVYFGFGIGTESPKKEAVAAAKSVAQGRPQRRIPAWNIALGNVVVIAPELGYGVKTAKDTVTDPSKIASRIESQLQPLRVLYRQEGAQDPTLMGGMMLQLSVGPSGEIIQVKEVISRITDGDFKKAVLAEVSKWSFSDVIAESMTINCPLLFVREGMDITTVVQWEKASGQFSDEGPLARGGITGNLIQQSKAVESPKRAAVAPKAEAANPQMPILGAGAKTVPAAYQTKYVTSMRKEPNFSSAAIGKLAIGTKVSVIAGHGEWLEVRAEGTGQSGFIRKEFVSLVEVAHK